MDCVICHTPMDPVLAPATTHPMCLFADVDDHPDATQLKYDLIEIIRWYDEQNPRSHQPQLGPSEIGSVCDRQIGYRLAAVPVVNKDFDPWPSIVGTAVHSWLESAVTAWSQAHGTQDWITETEFPIDEFVKGHSDLYNIKRAMVIDHKSAGPDLMKKYRKDGPPPGYVIQVHVYGLGFERQGLPVKKVALAFYPRAGWLKDMYVWVADYDRSVAEKAMARVYEIAQKLMDLDILKESNGHRWEQVEATPSNSCGFCSWYQKEGDLEVGANEYGCPGR